MIENSAGGTVFTDKDIRRYQIAVLEKALKLELLGMSRHGASAYSIVKHTFGFKGNKRRVHEQLVAWIAKHVTPYLGNDEAPGVDEILTAKTNA